MREFLFFYGSARERREVVGRGPCFGGIFGPEVVLAGFESFEGHGAIAIIVKLDRIEVVSPHIDWEVFTPVVFDPPVTDASTGLEVTHSGHISPRRGGAPSAQAAARPTSSGDAVVLETELMKIAQTRMDHAVTANLYRKHLDMFRMVLARR